jgi:hypothetical protein
MRREKKCIESPNENRFLLLYGEKIKDWMNLFRGSNTSMQKKKNR